MNIAIEYQVSKMEKELDELSTFFEDKKNVVNLVDVIQEKYVIYSDILIIIYNFLLKD